MISRNMYYQKYYMDTFFSKNKYYLMEAFSECSIYFYCYVFESIIIVKQIVHIRLEICYA